MWGWGYGDGDRGISELEGTVCGGDGTWGCQKGVHGDTGLLGTRSWRVRGHRGRGNRDTGVSVLGQWGHGDVRTGGLGTWQWGTLEHQRNGGHGSVGLQGVRARGESGMGTSRCQGWRSGNIEGIGAGDTRVPEPEGAQRGQEWGHEAVRSGEDGDMGSQGQGALRGPWAWGHMGVKRRGRRGWG